MLSHEKNAILTQSGPGQPMGRFMRSFWIPAMTAREVPAPDEAPVRLQLLNENLVVFRDSAGQVGVLEEHCPHRGASLFFGRNEEGGLRCVYHGWKFDVEGGCMEMPTEPSTSRMRHNIKAKAYPARIAGGLLWVYLGEARPVPVLPAFGFLGLPPEQVYASRWHQECNYAQAMEGELDSAHVGFLHRMVSQVDTDHQALTGKYFQEDTAPAWKILPGEAGFMACNGRRVDGDKRYWRLNQFLLPFYTMIPPRPGDAQLVRMWVPMTDERCWVICVTWRPEAPLGAQELAAWRNGENSHRKVIPGTTTPVEHKDNDYLIDRQLQKTVSFTGIHGIRAQDAMVTESAGPIADRTREHLGSSDLAVVAMRRTLVEAATKCAESGAAPAAVAKPWLYTVYATQAVLPQGMEPDAADEIIQAARARAPQAAANRQEIA
ncbi:Rieske 2Fe-2S domain-containing protein [Ramlibacter ginsenosidimutans]|uniref:Rieske 2Fe-2S domain-containing protein n=1 Tax=Ramlibacter ginsenosidimutans TaxID=502333 RepID=A0A934WMX7_9BURK|nr:Rieske 2Fe-2S domain-containing protein [Ramlibacter ginsenosidimutans]MBK6007070.1 Rieske 2Fe-2S domain-containing protein [Ramlibacter ginsenosidimutans]